MAGRGTVSQVHLIISPFHVLRFLSTCSAAISWAIYGLCVCSDCQRKFHAEIRAVTTDAPTYDELNSLPLLDAVVRETLRTYPTAPAVFRVTVEDTVLPLSKPYVDEMGRSQTLILCAKREFFFSSVLAQLVYLACSVAKNTTIYIPILEINRNNDVWGPDGASFNSECWLRFEVPEGAPEMPSVAMLCFLAGPRGCIGFRFAVMG